MEVVDGFYRVSLGIVRLFSGETIIKKIHPSELPGQALLGAEVTIPTLEGRSDARWPCWNL